MDKVLIKKAKAIVTCDGSDRVCYDEDILVEGNVIKKIGKDLTSEGATVISGEDAIVYPGLINTHHHMIQAFTRNIPALEFNKGITLFEWLTYCYQLWKKNNPEYLYYASLISMSEGLKYGCTTIFDQQYIYPQGRREHLIDSQFRAASDMGIRYHSGRSCMTMTEKDGGLPPDVLGETTKEVIDDLDRIVDLYHDKDAFAMQRVVAAPCSPFSVAQETYEGVVEFARDKGIHIHSHLAEDSEEIDYMVNRYGKRSLEWAVDIGLIGPDIWYAHGNYFNDDELKIIGERGGGIAYCPIPQMILGAEILNIPKCESLGVTISLGTDGQGVQDGSNMMEVLRTTYLLQCAARVLGRDYGPTAYSVLKNATNGGAKILGRSDIGSLEVGKAADLFLVDVSGLENVGALEDPASFLGKVGYHKPTLLTMVNGKVVAKEGKLLNIDEEKMVAEARKAASSFR